MFGKKCPRCNNKIDKKFSFCPFCGTNIMKEEDENDFGLLGRDDRIGMPDFKVGMPMGFDRIFNSLLKQVDQQFRDLDRQIGKEMKDVNEMPKQNIRPNMPRINSKGISISISTANGKKPEIKVSGFGPGFENIKVEEKPMKIEPQLISEEKARRLSKLPKEEAETKVRRMSNKIEYELTLPCVEKLSDVIINKLENSIEIKAFSKDKVYFKLLPVNLPILKYKLEEGKLFLELKAV